MNKPMQTGSLLKGRCSGEFACSNPGLDSNFPPIVNLGLVGSMCSPRIKKNHTHKQKKPQGPVNELQVCKR